MLAIRSRFRAGLILAAALLVGVSSLSFVSDTALAAPPVCGDISCDIEIVDPGGGGVPSDPAPDPETGLTPGPTECASSDGTKVPCSTDDGSWSNASQCYWKLDDTQGNPPTGEAEGSGAWYSCCNIPSANPLDLRCTSVWRDTPPPGVSLTPAQAAARIIQTMTFEGIQIGMAPEVNPEWGHRRTYVGVPVWLWAANPSERNWGPYVVTASLGGQSITVNANVTSVLWNMGDGGTVACTAGTPYTAGYGFADSPSCGYRFQKMSKNQPGNRWTVTATSQWAVDWTGGGQSGSIPMTATSTDNLEVRELQTVNVSPNG